MITFIYLGVLLRLARPQNLSHYLRSQCHVVTSEEQHAHSDNAHIPLLKFHISGLSLSTPLGLCYSSVQHMCALASSHAYMYNHHACTKVGHSPIAPSWGMKPL